MVVFILLYNNISDQEREVLKHRARYSKIYALKNSSNKWQIQEVKGKDKGEKQKIMTVYGYESREVALERDSFISTCSNARSAP
jgi:hypothetical protein